MNIEKEIQALKKQTKSIRKRRLGISRLDRFKGEILSLYKNDASISELQGWLRKNQIKVTYSTVYRWVQKNG